MNEEQLLEFVRNGAEVYEGARVEAKRDGITGNALIKEGMQGTVRHIFEDKRYAGVDWDEHIDGHTLHNNSAKNGHGWNTYVEDIRVIGGTS